MLCQRAVKSTNHELHGRPGVAFNGLLASRTPGPREFHRSANQQGKFLSSMNLHQFRLLSVLFCLLGFGLTVYGCNTRVGDPSVELERLRSINQAFDSATALTSQRMEDLKDRPNDERTARSLQIYFATLEPALTQFLDAPPPIDVNMESDLREWRKIVAELNKLYTGIVDSERYDLPEDEQTRLNELLLANDKVETKISAYVYNLLDRE